VKIKLDENLSRYLKALLEQQGHEVKTAGERDCRGNPTLRSRQQRGAKIE